ncbi:MAG: 4Fe-4S dicluster domain-containing protein [Lachnospiraceae bacterium]|nr:4Fe-4S dicluster domain-containing protein [Lachnospiraceae bacterium]
MVNITINGKALQVPEGITILEAAAQGGFKIPTLCFLKDINEIGACRVCLVEIEGKDNLVAACNNVVDEGMIIYTNTPKVRSARKTNVELILSTHEYKCATCIRSGNCQLQTVANDLGIIEIPYIEELEKRPWDHYLPLVKESEKCIKCMRCVQVCDKVQGLNIWDIVSSGRRTSIDVAEGIDFEKSACSLCGQCITHCPTGALRERNDTDRYFDALADPDKIVIVQIAPAVRAAWGEAIGLPREKATIKRLVNAIRKTGADYIFDTNFSADLTIMEEGSEFLEKFTHKEDYKWPMFTSCCPGWIRFAKSQYPEIVPQISTAKSPQQMFGAVAKSYYADLLRVDPERIFSVSIMPCTAKKHECELPNMNDAGAGQDVDLVLTTREVARIIKADQIIPELLVEEEFDAPLGVGSGAAVIFGATGGVMEAALRSVHYLITGKNPDPDAFSVVRGMDGIKEAEIEIAGNKVRGAVVSGLGNTRKLLERIKSGEAHYDFVEVMACPGGCAGGGGQPICDGVELADVRAENLYSLDKNNTLRFSHENPSVIKAYDDYFQKPLSHKSHQLLHTDLSEWDMPFVGKRKK